MADETEKMATARRLLEQHNKHKEKRTLAANPEARWSTQALRFGLHEVYHRCCYNPFCPGRSQIICADHITPKGWPGGGDDIGNLQPLCIDCNGEKFAEEIDFRTCWSNPFAASRLRSDFFVMDEPQVPELTEDDFREDRVRIIGDPYRD